MSYRDWRRGNPVYDDLQEEERMKMTEEIEVTPFDWHKANKESFLSWAIVVMLAGHESDTSTRVIEVMDRSKGARDLHVTLDVNGVSFDAVPFFERLWQEMQHQAKLRAADLVEDELAKLNETRAVVERTLTIAELDIRRHFKDLGLPMNEEDY